jgi:hypothetical protein
MHQWRKERIWIEAINHENNSRKNWDENWAFMADYDPKVKNILYLSNGNFIFLLFFIDRETLNQKKKCQNV